MKYPVSQVFFTLQGEARYTGTPATFIRLQGCPVGCGWCDTKYTWEVDEAHATTLGNVLAKGGSTETPAWAWATVDDLCKLADTRHVVITGGEPCLYDLHPLADALHRTCSVQIETSGTREIKAPSRTWVTVSPKINMPGGFKVREDALRRADEIKFPVGKARDLDVLREHVLPYVLCNLIWLQPLSQSPKATQLCIDAARREGWRVSIQTHKYIGLP